MGVGVGDEEVGGGRPGCAWVDGGGVREVGAMLKGTPHARSAAPTHHHPATPPPPPHAHNLPFTPLPPPHSLSLPLP